MNSITLDEIANLEGVKECRDAGLSDDQIVTAVVDSCVEILDKRGNYANNLEYESARERYASRRLYAMALNNSKS